MVCVCVIDAVVGGRRELAKAKEGRNGFVTRGR
jgi:hypothetical protein